MATLNLGKREVECDERLRLAIDQLQEKYPKSFEQGILSDAAFLSVQMDIDIYRNDDEIKQAVCDQANAAASQIGAANFLYSL